MSITYKKGDKDIRPWGSWEVLSASDGYCVKKIRVKPQSMLSLQLHHHRSEHWTIVEGNACITLGNEQFIKKTDESVYIPVNTKHRIENKTAKDMVFIEIQTGDELDENDIVRFDDKYGRTSSVL